MWRTAGVVLAQIKRDAPGPALVKSTSTMIRTSTGNTRFVGVDLFSGAGGMTLGAKQAGVTVLVAVENDPHACTTHEANHKDVKLCKVDVQKWHEFPEAALDDVKILFGGAPCQGFSTSNQRTRDCANESNWLFTEFLRVAEEWTPEWVVFENVSFSRSNCRSGT